MKALPYKLASGKQNATRSQVLVNNPRGSSGGAKAPARKVGQCAPYREDTAERIVL
jgi:hypothetical protein